MVPAYNVVDNYTSYFTTEQRKKYRVFWVFRGGSDHVSGRMIRKGFTDEVMFVVGLEETG